MIQTFSMPIAVNGLNGKAVNITNSATVSLSYFTETNNKIKVNTENSSGENYEILIKKQLSPTEIPKFKFQNLTSLNYSLNENLIFFGTNIANKNSSLHIQIKPLNFSVSYLILLKYNQNPSLIKYSFDLSKVVCPGEDLIEYQNESYYQVFSSVNNTFTFLKEKYVGIGIRELNLTEHEIYCINKTLNKTDPTPFANLKPGNLTSDFAVRIFTSGCYYMDKSTGKWSSAGMEVIEQNTNLEFTNCRSTHLTDFAGGFLVVPNDINFENVFANASFDKNPTIYLTVIILSSIYILAAVLCAYMDKRDVLKARVHILTDNRKDDSYFYEICVYTGSRKSAETKSKVFINISGTFGDSSIRELNSKDSKEKNPVFKRSAVDTFVMSTRKPLGSLYMCRVFHDNSGESRNDSSWYLKHIIISDLQTGEKYIFICEKWLATDKDDGEIDRNLAAAGESEQKNLKYLLSRQTKDKLSDGHLWFSILARPTLSSFTRLDRLTCGFVLLFMTMLVNILYYDIDRTPKADGINIGPFSFTPQQVNI